MSLISDHVVTRMASGSESSLVLSVPFSSQSMISTFGAVAQKRVFPTFGRPYTTTERLSGNSLALWIFFSTRVRILLISATGGFADLLGGAIRLLSRVAGLLSPRTARARTAWTA